MGFVWFCLTKQGRVGYILRAVLKNWRQIVSKRAEVWLSMTASPLLVKELSWRLIRFVAECGKCNPISFWLRLLFEHGRLRTGCGVGLAGLAIAIAIIRPLPSLATATGGKFEIATVDGGKIEIETIESVVDPLPYLEVSQKFWLLHSGIDLRVPAGTPIRPIMAGRVIKTESGRWSGGYGKHVIIEHDNGFESLYAHMSEVEVMEGQSVDTNTVLGGVGTTGRSTGPHLHLEVREDGNLVNPASFLGL